MRQIAAIVALTLFICIGFGGTVQAQQLNDSISEPDSAVNLFEFGNSLTLSQKQLRILPFQNLSVFGLVSPSAYSLKGGRMFYYGIESSGNHTFIDGMQIGDAADYPSG